MCGIIGCVGHADATLDVVLDGLETLGYRGYDSAGVALVDGDIDVERNQGRLEALREEIAEGEIPPVGPIGIGHTQWSTHGPPTDANAHPHTDEAGRVAVVHNGSIENYQELRDEFEADGVTFTSETDTEVIPHLFAAYLNTDLDAEVAFRRTIERIEGSFAIAAVVAGDDRIFTIRNDSPLVLGVGDEQYHLASEVPAFLEHTHDVVYLDDGEVTIISANGWEATDRNGQLLERDVSTVTWSGEQTGKSGYDHYMLKEFNDQPTALRQGLSSRLDELSGEVTVKELRNVGTPKTVQFVACGTSHHAALYGVELFREAGVPAQASLASVYATGPALIPNNGLVVGVTQSGETADTLSALREVQRRGAETLAVTNVVGSTAARDCDYALYLYDGDTELEYILLDIDSKQKTGESFSRSTIRSGASEYDWGRIADLHLNLYHNAVGKQVIDR